jgi:flagellar basal-body rod protein FlgG
MLDNIMKLAAANANKQFEVLEQVTKNIANINTTGYKNTRFEQYIMPDGRLEGVQRSDTSQGSSMVTKRDLDIAIDGFGYLPVTQPDGTTAYTRDGSLALNSEGYLVTQRGDLVGGGIKIPVNYDKIQIKPEGTVQVTLKAGEQPKELGKISLVRFADPESLKTIGYNKLVVTPESGDPVADPDSKIKQGILERANVNVHFQIDQILRLNAGLISNMRIIKFTDDIYRQSVNLKQ